MGMKNLKGGEVCSASGGRFLPDMIYNCTEYKAKLTTNVFNLYMTIIIGLLYKGLGVLCLAL